MSSVPPPVAKALTIPEGWAKKLMIYGFPGIGKTELLGTANEDPRTSPLLIIDFEGGWTTIQEKARIIKIEKLGNPEPGIIDVVRVKTWSDLQAIYDFVVSAKSDAITKRAVYQAIGVDTLTEINNLALRHAMDTSPQARLEIDVPEQRDYLKTNDLMKRLLRALRDLEGVHVFISVHAQYRAEENSSLARLMPSLIGKLAIEAMAMYDYVGYMRVAAQNGPVKPGENDRPREIIFQPEGRIEAKERSPRDKQIKKIHDPTITKIFDKIGVKNYAS